MQLHRNDALHPHRTHTIHMYTHKHTYSMILRLIHIHILPFPPPPPLPSLSPHTTNILPTWPHSDGIGRTGTFICIHAQLERLKTEGIVDFFQSIKSTRIHRAGLVAHVVSSVFIAMSELDDCIHYNEHFHFCFRISIYSVTELCQTMWMILIHMLTSKNLFDH